MYRTQQQNIKNTVNSLSLWDTTGIEPSKHGQDDENTQLDILARILTDPKDACIALCLWEGELLVASNRKTPQVAQRDLKKWREFVKYKSDNKRLILMQDALEKSFNMLRTANKIKELKNNKSIVNNKGRKDCLQDFFDLSSQRSKGNKRWWEEEVEEKVNKVFKLILELRSEGNIKLANEIWDIISPIEDSNKMAELVSEDKINESLLNAIESSKIALIDSENGIHAEMKIIDCILGVPGGKGYFYIGIGKLCCLPCQKVVDVINESGQYRIGVPGTHGKTYPNWKLLKVFENNSAYGELCQRLEKVLDRINKGKYAWQVRESTCHFPDRLASFKFGGFIAQQVRASTPSWGISTI